MRSVGLLPALPLVAGAAAGIALVPDPGPLVWLLAGMYLAAVAAWWGRLDRGCAVLIGLTFLTAGAALGVDARAGALEPPLRRVLDQVVGGVALASLGPEGNHGPLDVRVGLLEDAAVFGDYASLRAGVMALKLDGTWQAVDGGVRLSVGGAAFRSPAGQWRAGRVIEAPLTFRRPDRYLNDGVADFERDLALSGTALFGSIKSALLVEIVERGGAMQEWSGRVRAHVRRAVERRVSLYDPLSGALVTAVLIGDRAGLPDDIRDRLQQAGTYHVIAISGGNIAILAGLGLAALAGVGIRGRVAALIAGACLLVYAQVVTAGPSVWRATAMAVIYLAARVIDHRAPAWQTTALAAAVMTVVRPLDVRDVGFILTFGATAALLEGARRAARVGPDVGPAAWVLASLAASAAVEAVLMPVSAQVFSRITFAGVLLNLLAVPLMGVVQVAGLVVAARGEASSTGLLDQGASLAGWIAHLAASALVGSARLLDVAPWLSFRVPPPGPVVLIVYYSSGALLVFGRRRPFRACSAAVLGAAAAVIITGWSPTPTGRAPGVLRLTMFDVGQAESMLLELPDGPDILVDTGGAPFGDTLDIGARVLAPALWARGLRALDGIVVTHGDPDHLGGAAVLVDEFHPRDVWEGIVVPSHVPMAEVRAVARARDGRIAVLRAGQGLRFGETTVRVLHPAAPDWERPRVRNDDSVVLEVRYRDAAILLTGDISQAIERAILPQLTAAPIRILKVAHHGSRTSSSTMLLEAWRPQFALISAGRGNSFGHPTPEVLTRLESVGATVLRTDRHGQIIVTTDGYTVQTTTFVEAVQ